MFLESGFSILPDLTRNGKIKIAVSKLEINISQLYTICNKIPQVSPLFSRSNHSMRLAKLPTFLLPVLVFIKCSTTKRCAQKAAFRETPDTTFCLLIEVFDRSFIIRNWKIHLYNVSNNCGVITNF